MLKFILFFLLVFSLSYADEYPKIYSQMGTPLFESIKKLSKLSDTNVEVQDTITYGLHVDNKDKNYISSQYLVKLRNLQKEYNYMLHVVHNDINKAIDHDDYDLFIKLTSYKFDGLLKNTALLNKSLTYYKKTSSKIKCPLLEEKILFKKNLHVEFDEYYYIVYRGWAPRYIDAIHNDEYIYRLPYAKGTSHVVGQGYNGKVSHKGFSKYAIDFSMKIGTKIYAARAAKVIKTKSNSNKGGGSKEFRPYANFITIEHDDNTMSTYYHLKYKGVLVKVGQKVAKGQVIGYSGNTGYSTGPHLHFAVFKARSIKRTKTIAVKLQTADGVLTNPQQAKRYIAK